MNIKEIVKEDNQEFIKKKEIKKKQKVVIRTYEKNIELENSLVNKLRVNQSYRNEVHKFFRDNGFEKSDKDHEGRILMTDEIISYKYKNSWITVTFNEYSETEKIIEIIRPLKNEFYRLIYRLNNNSMKILELEDGFRLNNENIYLTNYKDIILQCDSIEELSNLEKKIKEHIEYLEFNLNKDLDVSCVYQLDNGDQFVTFVDAFNKL